MTCSRASLLLVLLWGCGTGMSPRDVVDPPRDVPTMPTDQPQTFDVPFADAPLEADASVDASNVLIAEANLYVQNGCVITSMPRELSVPAGQTARIAYRNRSIDTALDLYGDYGGGYSNLAPGAVWFDRYVYCDGDRVFTHSMEITLRGGATSMCPMTSFKVHCL